MAVARSLGSLVRAIGGTGKGVEPTMRRDGVGLGLVVGAVVVAAVAWFGLSGPVGAVVNVGLTGLIGGLVMVVPFVLIWLAWRTLRYPGERMPRSVLWGWIVTGLAVCALWQCLAGAPVPMPTQRAPPPERHLSLVAGRPDVLADIRDDLDNDDDA